MNLLGRKLSMLHWNAEYCKLYLTTPWSFVSENSADQMLIMMISYSVIEESKMNKSSFINQAGRSFPVPENQ